MTTCSVGADVMVHNLAIIVVGQCLFALSAIALPNDFAMPVDDDGNLGLGKPKPQPAGHKKNGPSGDRPWGR